MNVNNIRKQVDNFKLKYDSIIYDKTYYIDNDLNEQTNQQNYYSIGDIIDVKKKILKLFERLCNNNSLKEFNISKKYLFNGKFKKEEIEQITEDFDNNSIFGKYIYVIKRYLSFDDHIYENLFYNHLFEKNGNSIKSINKLVKYGNLKSLNDLVYKTTNSKNSIYDDYMDQYFIFLNRMLNNFLYVCKQLDFTFSKNSNKKNVFLYDNNNNKVIKGCLKITVLNFEIDNCKIEFKTDICDNKYKDYYYFIYDRDNIYHGTTEKCCLEYINKYKTLVDSVVYSESLNDFYNFMIKYKIGNEKDIADYNYDYNYINNL